jgi:2-haloacid dehalogenase
VLSADAAGIFKPSPRVYRLAVDRLGLAAPEIGFVSSNGWDAAGAKAFGFTTFWINRYGLPIERHAPAPDFVFGSLANIAALAI